MSTAILAGKSPGLQVSQHSLLQYVAIYMRVSSDEQAEKGTIETQRDFLRKFANLYQLQVADEYADDGITGTLPLGERPEGRRLIQDAEAGRFGVVLVYRLTRLGRSLKALTDAHDILSRFTVTIRSATEPFDTSSPIGNFLFQLLGSLAELDRAQVLEQLSRGRDRVAGKGKWTDGLVPFGYMLDQDGCLTPSTRVISAIGMTEAEAVRDLFDRMAAGSSALAEARRLNALNVPTTRYYGNGTAREGKRWYPGNIAWMLNNPTYRGMHVLQSRYGAIERAVSPLVDTALWEQANTRLKQNQHLPKGNATRTYLLRGLITCGECGSSYGGQIYTARNGTRGAYYRCGRRNPDHYVRQEPCRARVANAAWLENIVWGDCHAFILNPGDALAEAQRQLQDRLRDVARLEQERSQYLQALTETARRRDDILTLVSRGRTTLQEAEKYLEAIAAEEAELRRQCSAMDAQKALTEAYQAHMTDATRLLQDLRARIEDVEQADDQAIKRQVIECLLQGIRIDTTAQRAVTATITYAFSSERVAISATACVVGHTPVVL